MKCLFLMQLPPPVHGASMVNQLISQSDYINSKFDCRFVDISPAKEVGDIGRATFSKLLRSVQIIIDCVNVYVRFKPDIVYLTLSPHGLAFWKDSVLAILIKFLGGKCIFHMHGKGVLKESRKSKFREWYYKLVFKDVEVIHLSKLLKFDVEPFVPSSSIHIVNNGIPDNARKGIQSKRKSERVKFVYLSNFIKEKGALDLMRAAILLKEKSSLFNVTFVGKFFDSGFEEEFKNLLNTSGLENINLVEGLYGKEKDELLSGSDVFVLPTYYKNECFPLTILEAMSHEMAVIATDEGAISDIITHQENGIIVRKNTPQDIADAMKLYIEDKELLEKTKLSCRRKYLEKYSLQAFEKRLVECLIKCRERLGSKD